MGAMQFKAFYLSITLMAGLSLLACQDKDSGEKAQGPNQAILTVGTSADMPPFEFYASDVMGTGITGFDIELIRAIAKQLSLEIKINDMDFSTLIPSLQAGRVDVIVASMTPSPERRKNVDFSDTYLELPLVAITKAGVRVKDSQDFKGKKIGVQLGSSHEQTVHAMAKKDPSIQVVSLNKLGELVQELAVGRIHAVLMELTSAQEFVASNKELTMNVIPDHQVAFAIAFAKGSPWVPKVNQALKRLIDAGEVDKLKQKWFKLSS